MQGLSRTILVCLVVVVLSGLAIPPVLAREMGHPATSAVDAVGELEAAFWGQAKPGAVVERTAALERALFGKAEEGPLLVRVTRLREFLLPGGPNSVATRLSSLEVAIFERVSSQPFAPRLDEVEKALAGSPSAGALLLRIEGDLRVVGLNGEQVTHQTVPAGLPVRIKLLQALGTDTVAKDQTVTYQVVQSVVVGGVTLIAAGARGTAHVVAAKAGGAFGRDGRLELDFCSVTAVDGALAPLTSVRTAFTPSGGDKSRAMAAGAGVAGMVLAGPVGAASSALVKGHEVEFPAGSEFELTTAGGPSVTVLGK